MNISIQMAAKIDAMHKPANCKLIMLDSPDGCCKSTILKILAQCSAYRLAPGADNGKQEQRNDDLAWQAGTLIPQAKAFEGITLLYRSWLSDAIYPQFKGKAFDAGRVQYLMQELFIELHAMLIIIQPSRQLLESGYEEYSSQKYQKLNKLYKQHYNCWPNTAVISMDAI